MRELLGAERAQWLFDLIRAVDREEGLYDE